MFSKNYPYIIAEVASAHEGNPNLAIEIAKYAIKAKADAVKFQIFNSEKLLSSNNPFFKKFKKIELSFKEWRKVIRSIDGKKVSLIAEVFDNESLLFAENLNAFKAYKIPSACLNDESMLKTLRKINKPVILGVGGAEFKEIKYAYKKLKGSLSNINLMCGFQNFPTKVNETRLNQITNLKNHFKSSIGFADHSDAEFKNLAFGIPLMAYALGANVIEKHITNNRRKKGTDYYSSLNPNEFVEFVSLIKTSKDVFGASKGWALTKAEKKYKKFTKKFAVARFNIKKGDVITKKNIAFKRTNKIGISQINFSYFFGKKIIKNKSQDDMILLKEIR